MKLYVVHCNGEVTNNLISIVSIWKSRESALNAMDKYIENWSNYLDHAEHKSIPDYTIDEIDTDTSDNCIYDCEWFE